jgi:hypothetical protein
VICRTPIACASGHSTKGLPVCEGLFFSVYQSESLELFMWKIAVGFAVFAGLALFILSKGGDIDMSGEKHGTEATSTHEAASAPAPAQLSASAPK